MNNRLHVKQKDRFHWRFEVVKIKAIDTHCHIHYGPKESLVPNTHTKFMKEGEFYTAYWDELSRIEESAQIGIALPCSPAG